MPDASDSKPQAWPLGSTAASVTSSVIAKVQPCAAVREGQAGSTGGSWKWPQPSPLHPPFIHPADVADRCGPGAVQEETAQGSCPQHEDFRRQTRTAFGSCPVCDPCVFTFTSGDQLHQEL